MMREMPLNDNPHAKASSIMRNWRPGAFDKISSAT
jgi:hypothetical protein